MLVKSTTITHTSDIKRSRFIKIVERRANRVLDNLDSLGKCSNRKNYDYSDEDVKKLFREIERKVKETKLLFQETSKNKRRFKLEA